MNSDFIMLELGLLGSGTTKATGLIDKCLSVFVAGCRDIGGLWTSIYYVSQSACMTALCLVSPY